MKNISILLSDGNFSQFLNYDEWEKAVEKELQEIGIHSSVTRGVLIGLYGVSALLSIVGNAIIIAVVLIRKRSSTSKSNWNNFFVNLALADILMACFCIPFTFTQVMLGKWVLGETMCSLTLFFQVLTVSVSILTNTAIGIERYRAVLYPLKPPMNTTKIRVALVGIWLASIVISLPQLFIGRVRNHQLPLGATIPSCNENWPDPKYREAYTMVILFLAYIIPLVILAISYIRIAIALRGTQTPGNADTSRDTRQQNKNQKVIKMLGTIVLAFGVLWLPLHIFNLILDFAPSLIAHLSKSAFTGIYLACHWLAMSNSFTNVFIYWRLNESFVNDCKLIWHVYVRNCRICNKSKGQRDFNPRASFRFGVSRQISWTASTSVRSTRSGRSRGSDESLSSPATTPVTPVTTQRMAFIFDEPIQEVSITE